MSAVKQFYSDCADAGFIPLGNDSMRRLDDLNDQLDLYWIEYMTHPYLGFDNTEYRADGISIESGVTLHNMGVDIDEISDFLDLWCDRCNDCNSVGRYAMTRHGETFCNDCQ